jgi:hypothetical protein
MRAGDTTPEANEVQLGVFRRLGPADRLALASRMSEDARLLALAGIRARHPDYGPAEAELALRRFVLGDELFAAAWPRAARLDP